ncbi:MAG: hypothetical protein ABTQ26_08795 [Azonexus sp.]
MRALKRLRRALRNFSQRCRNALWFKRRCHTSWADAWERAGECF